MDIESTARDSPALVHLPAPLARLAELLERQSRTTLAVLSTVLVLVVCVIDALTGPQLAFSIFYLLPVSIAAWHLGWRAGLLTVLASGAAWLVADRLAGHVYTVPAIQYWNALVRTSFFFIVAYILTLLKQALHAERELARTDALTGLSNQRSFIELGEREVARAHRLRRPITLAYLDVDGFKAVNDTGGHAAGDLLLRDIAMTLLAETRDIDVVGRLGGDEFALVLPDVGPAAARIALERVLRRLEETSARSNWGVGYSLGVVTADHPGVTLQGLMRQADHLMYEVKRNGGRQVAYLNETVAAVDRARPLRGMQ